MFSRNKNKIPAGTVVRTVPSIISNDLNITGDLLSDGEIQVDGNVTGDIRAKVLLVGKSAVINGEIFADTVRVHGNVNGQIKAKFVNLAKTARVVGDIHHENLSIQEGAFLEGHMLHINQQETAVPKPKSNVEAAPVADPIEVKTAPAPAPAPVKEPVKADVNGKPAEDRVNLVVKSNKQVLPNKPAPVKHDKYPSPQNKTV